MKTTIVVLSIFVASAADAQEWVGIWAAEPDWCAFKNEIGSAFPAPIRLTPDKMEGLENSCDITSVEPVDVGNTWILHLDCFGEGMQSSARELVSVSDRNFMVRITEGGSIIPMYRCE